ncbi:hypothetical protein AJ79_01096 [Helicocarpus griseus UAMH5409]|uniref:Uncharacterized protein n=1 Tax=Helicocarpus griseus UAMH5409 TaxID=1447875 RepID=A0A2B7Y7M3_9EURO|nr:hypothetical protein AJ79_01096 [Helicocarpus griseus UAMH5409]
MIRLKTSETEFTSLKKAFESTTSRFTRTPRLSYYQQFYRTALALRQSAVHVAVISFVNDALTQELEREEKDDILETSLGGTVMVKGDNLL